MAPEKLGIAPSKRGRSNIHFPIHETSFFGSDLAQLHRGLHYIQSQLVGECASDTRGDHGGPIQS